MSKFGVFLYKGFQEMEFWYPVLRLREIGADVVVIGVDGSEAASSMLGYPVVPNVAMKDVARRVRGADRSRRQRRRHSPTTAPSVTSCARPRSAARASPPFRRPLRSPPMRWSPARPTMSRSGRAR